MELFEAADLAVERSSSVAYRASIDDPRIGDVRILRPQEIPVYVAEGLFDLGITGRDWIEETASSVVTLGELRYSKATAEPIKLVLAVADDSTVTSVKELPAGVRVSTEYPELTRRYFAGHGIDADVRLSYGASEAKVPDIADCVVEITETGRALRAAGLRIVDTILVSYTEVIANPQAHADPDKRHAMGQLMTLLNGALDARGKVLLKLNVAADRYDAVLAVLPVGEGADGVRARRRSGLRRRERGRQAHDQPADPGAARRRGHGPAGDADLQDRPVSSTRTGTSPRSTTAPASASSPTATAAALRSTASRSPTGHERSTSAPTSSSPSCPSSDRSRPPAFAPDAAHVTGLRRRRSPP